MDINSQQKLAQSLYDGIFSMLTDAPAGQEAIRSVDNTFLTLQKPGLRLNSRDFVNPWSPGNTSGNQSATRTFARMVNAIPQIGVLHRTSGDAADIYGSLILNPQIVPPPPDPALEKAYNEAKTFLTPEVTVTDEDTGETKKKVVESPVYKEYKAKKQAYDLSRATFVDQFTKAQATQEGRETWPLKAPIFQAAVSDAYDTLIAAEKVKVEDALAKMEFASNNQVGRAFDDAVKLFKSYEAKLDGDTIYRCRALPSDWYDSTAAGDWPEMSFSSDQLVINQHSEYSKFSAGGGFNAGLWSVGASASSTTEPYHMDTETNNLSVKFKYQLVTIDRPWMREFLFKLPGWSLGANFPPGKVSNGTKQNQGSSLMPLISESFVVIRDLEIKAHWGKTDLDQIKKSVSGGGSVGFLCFSLSGGYSHSSSSSTYKAKFEDGVIKASGLQIIGWVNNIIPFSAPR